MIRNARLPVRRRPGLRHRRGRPVRAWRRATVARGHRAVYDLKLAQSRGKRDGSGGARAHPVRFFRQRLRGLCAAIPAGLRARFRRRQDRAERPARDHLGGRRRPRDSASTRRIFSTRSRRQRRRAAPSAGRRRRSEPEQAARTRRSTLPAGPCFRPSTCAGSSPPPAPGRRFSTCPSMMARKPARRSTTRSP